MASRENRLTRLKADVRSRLMYSLERRCISRSSLGLFHGASCYTQYAPWCRTPYLVQDYPLPEVVVIGAERLREKINGVLHSGPLTLAYIGRTDEMKGPLDWLEVMEKLHQRGVLFQATWIGDGPMLAEMREEVARRGMEQYVSLPGFVEDRRRCSSCFSGRICSCFATRLRNLHAASSRHLYLAARSLDTRVITRWN